MASAANPVFYGSLCKIRLNIRESRIQTVGTDGDTAPWYIRIQSVNHGLRR